MPTLPDGDEVTDREYRLHQRWPKAFWWYHDQMCFEHGPDTRCTDGTKLDDWNLDVFENICIAVEQQVKDGE